MNAAPPSFLPRLLAASHAFIGAVLESARFPLALDGTAGNGHDALFLAQAAGAHGHVFAYDVQAAALSQTAALLRRNRMEARVTLCAHGHENLGADMLRLFGPPSRGMLAAAMFNFGFLPGSDKRLATRAATSLAALDSLLPWLRPRGGLSLHLYAGHPGGEEERAAVAAWARSLPWKRFKVQALEFSNKERNPETLLLIEAAP